MSNKLMNFSTKSFVQLATAVVLLAVCRHVVVAQAPQRPDRGTSTLGTYSVSSLDNISLTNGNVNVSLPLASLPPVAGGKLSWAIQASYNSKLWNVTRTEFTGFQISYVQDSLQLADNGGWVPIGQGYTLTFHNETEDYAYVVPSDPSDPDYALLQSPWYRLMLRTPEGSEHELRPLDYTPWPGTRDYLKGYYKDTPDTTNQALRYYSFDGSYLWAVVYPTGHNPRAIVNMRDGTQILIRGNGSNTIFDQNNNSIKLTGTVDSNGVVTSTFLDVTGNRQFTYAFNPAQNSGQVQYPTVTGALVSVNVAFGTTTVQGKTYSIQDNGCSRTTLLPNTQVQVLRSITLPQTESGQPLIYQFGYNSDTTDSESIQYQAACNTQPLTVTTESHGMGDLSQIQITQNNIPVGAIVNYVYSMDGQGTLLTAEAATQETITTKTVTHDGTSDQWTYSISSVGTGATVVSPDSQTTAQQTYIHDTGTPGWVGGALSGLAYRTTRPGVQVVERHWTGLVFTPGRADGPGGGVVFNPVVDAEYTTLLDSSGNPSKMNAKTMQYDFNGNVTQETDYDWFNPSSVQRDSNGVPTGVPSTATVLRTITNTYYNSAPTPSSTNVYAQQSTTANATAPVITDLLQEADVDSSVTQLYYDNQALGVSPVKGNLSKQSRWDSSLGAYDNTTHVYDSFGNISSTTDPNGNVTSYTYDATTHAPMPTSVTVNPLNGTGTQISFAAYDASTGVPTSQTDVNSKVTSYDYTNQLVGGQDPYARVGVITYPSVAGGQRTVKTSYYDVERQVVQSADLTSSGDRLMLTRTSSDQLGRQISVETSEDGSTYTIKAQTAYQNMGQMTFASNPAHPAAGSASDGWTRTTRDNMGRVVEVASFSGATQPPATGTNTSWSGSVTTAFNANQTTVTDQTGNSRSSLLDGLGRLAQVNEDPSGHNYLTTYGYDQLGNLTSVNQGSQSRAYAYDSLSRLSTAKNPEQVNGSGQQIATSYSYDANGNLLGRTNPNGTSVTFAYDGLNRVKTKTLNNVGGVQLVWDYKYDDSTLLNCIGRLASVKLDQTIGSQIQGDGYTYSGYDALGRPAGGQQVTAGTSYPFTYGFNLAGGLTSEQYPSGRTITTTFDDTARVSGVTGSLAGVSTTYAGSFSYTPHGEIAAMKFGGTTVNLWVNAAYNSRLQPTQMGAGTSSTDYSKLELDYTFGLLVNGTLDTTKNNGNFQSQTIKIPSATFTQSYTYDSLNRLSGAQEASGANWKQTFLCDQYGNRTFDAANTTSNVLPPNNPTINPATNRFDANQGYTYDTSGNLTAEPGKTYDAYDAENHLTSFNSGSTTYTYDADGHRVTKSSGASTTVFVYDVDGRLVAEYGGPQGTDGGTSYLITDHLGSTRLITDGSGNVRARHDYLPFGEEIVAGIGNRTGQGYGGTDDTRQKFTSKERDNESMLDYFGARYYSSMQGRFVSIDKGHPELMEPQTWNRYQYARNNPFVYLDVDGNTDKPAKDARANTALATDPTLLEVIKASNNFSQSAFEDAFEQGAFRGDLKSPQGNTLRGLAGEAEVIDRLRSGTRFGVITSQPPLPGVSPDVGAVFFTGQVGDSKVTGQLNNILVDPGTGATASKASPEGLSTALFEVKSGFTEQAIINRGVKQVTGLARALTASGWAGVAVLTVDKGAWGRLNAKERTDIYNEVTAAGGYIQIVDGLAVAAKQRARNVVRARRLQ